jgi:hypothetical protein
MHIGGDGCGEDWIEAVMLFGGVLLPKSSLLIYIIYRTSPVQEGNPVTVHHPASIPAVETYQRPNPIRTALLIWFSAHGQPRVAC